MREVRDICKWVELPRMKRCRKQIDCVAYTDKLTEQGDVIVAGGERHM